MQEYYQLMHFYALITSYSRHKLLGRPLFWRAVTAKEMPADWLHCQNHTYWREIHATFKEL
jgi:hypothetical protein